jgi:RHS repeat-associated protein
VREELLDGGQVFERLSLYRYNADGHVTDAFDAEGVLNQSLYSRDDLADSAAWPNLDPVVGDVSMVDRMSFGNVLATVTRGRRAGPGTPRDETFWDTAPDVKILDSADDIITKFTYDPNSQLLLTRSDPRFTVSADPLHVESSSPGYPNYNPNNPRYLAHQRHLTRFVFGPGPRFELQQTVFPDRSVGGVTTVRGVVERYIRYDGNGRVLERVDPRGYVWINTYYPAAADPAEGCKEGYLRARLVPHLDWLLNDQAPRVLEVQTAGAWQATPLALTSGGAPGDQVSLTVEGVRVTLYQSSDLATVVSRHDRVAVAVDGHAAPDWDQTAAAAYVIDRLPTGLHNVVVRDRVGVPFSLGRVRTHVSLGYQVDGLGRVLVATDARGLDTVNVVDALGRKTRVTRGPAANPSVVDSTYDPADHLIRVRAAWRDEDGQERPEKAIIKRYQHDPAGLLLLSATGPEQPGPADRVSRNRYDEEDNLRETINALGRRTDFEYDTLNRRTRTTRAACSREGAVITTRYDLTNHVLSETNPRGATSYNGYRDAAGNWQPAIDPGGRVRVKTDPLGHRTVTDYDALDHPTVVRQFQLRADGSHELLFRRSTDYDEHGDVVGVTDAVFADPILTADPVGDPDKEFNRAGLAGSVQDATTVSFLDALGYTTARRNPDGGLQTYRVDGQGRVFDQVDPEGSRRFLIYDGNGNVVRTYNYDPARDPVTGRVVGVETFVQVSAYDELNRNTKTTDALGNTWENRYDSVGNRTRAIDPLGNVTRFDYNVFNEQVSRTQQRTSTGLGGGQARGELVTRMEYDAGGNLVAVTDPAGRRTEFVYDTLDRLVSSRFAVGLGQPAETRCYDPAGNLVRIVARNGLVRSHQYDLLDRRTRTDFDAAAVPPQDALSPLSPVFAAFRYDACGRLVRHENAYCICTLRLDSRGQAVREDVTLRNMAGAPAPQTIVRGFDVSGQRARLTYPSGREVDYTHNLQGQITAIRNTLAPGGYPGRPANAAGVDLVRYTYTGNRRARAELANGLTMVVRFDGLGRALEQEVTEAAGGVVWRSQRLRDGAGSTRVETALTRPGGRSRKLSLDSLYRLTHYHDDPANWVDPAPLAPPPVPRDPTAVRGQALLDAAIGPIALPGARPSYEYDDHGNRLQTHEPGQAPVASVPDALDQYATVDGVAWRYDDNGNLHSDSTLSFAYEGDDRIQEVFQAANNQRAAAYYRDALGRVVAEVTPGATTFRLHDGTLPLLELTPTGRVEYTPDPGGETVVHAAVGGGDYWVTRDGQGSVRLVTDAVGTATAIPTYRPFGAAEGGELALSPLCFGFAGLWYTPALTLWHAQERTYRPDLGCFLQRDPVGNADGRNLHAYLADHPSDGWDPTGLQDEEETDATVQYASSLDLYLTVPPAPFLSLGDFKLQSGLSESDTFTFGDSFFAKPGDDPSQGGAAFLAGAGATALGLLTIVTGGSDLIFLLPGAFLLSGGVAGVGIGAAQKVTSYSRTPEQEAQLNYAISATLTLGYSPGSLVGGVAGMLASGDESGLIRGAELGGQAEASAAIIYGGARLISYESRFAYRGKAFNWDSNLKQRIREARGLEFTKTTESRPNPLFFKGTEQLELSHWVPQRWFKESRQLRSIFNRPWNVTPEWGTFHVLIDAERDEGALFWSVWGSRYPAPARFLLSAPDWLRNIGYGAGRLEIQNVQRDVVQTP